MLVPADRAFYEAGLACKVREEDTGRRLRGKKSVSEMMVFFILTGRRLGEHGLRLPQPLPGSV